MNVDMFILIFWIFYGIIIMVMNKQYKISVVGYY